MTIQTSVTASSSSSVTAVRQYGAEFRVGVSNLAVDTNSGLIYIHPERKIRVTVGKTLPVLLNYDRLPSELRHHFQAGGNKEAGKAKFTEWFVREIKARMGKMYSPGEEILGLHEEGVIDVVLCRNSTVNQDWVLKGVKAPMTAAKGFAKDAAKSEVIKFQLTMDLQYETQYVKLRNDGIKGTTVPVEFKFFTDACGGTETAVEYDLIFPYEALKGRLAQLTCFCEAMGGGEVRTKDQTLTLDAPKDGMPKVIDLAKGDNEIYSQWLKTKTKTYWVEFTLASHEWKLMQKIRKGHIALTEAELTDETDMILVSESEDGRSVVIREKGQILWGKMVAEVEVSTAIENSNYAALTMEMIASASLQNPALGEKLDAEALTYRTGMTNVVAMLLNKAPEKAPSLRIDTASGRESLRGAMGKLNGLNDGAILSRFAKVYPLGVKFEGMSQHLGNSLRSMYLHGGIVKSMSTVIGGVADGVASDIVAMIVYLCDAGESGADQAAYSKLSLIQASLETWLMTAVQSQGLMKRMGRSNPHAAVGSKVRSCANYSFLGHLEGELPRVAVHSACGTLRLLAEMTNGGKINPAFCEAREMGAPGKAEGYVVNEEGTKMKLVFNPFLMNGIYVAACRTPMPMMTACTLVVSEEVDAVTSIAHVLILPSVWGPSNEGDTDGDGIVLLNLTNRGLAMADCVRMNKHAMGMFGYVIAYGNDPCKWPLAEFCSYKDKWGKKAVHWGFLPAEAEAAMVKGNKNAYITVLSAEVDRNSKLLVPAHYGSAVGTAYNICVVLTHKALSAQAKGDMESLKKYSVCMAIVWRLLYEGLGLAGYSPSARKFFKLLLIGTFPGKAGFENAIYRLKEVAETQDNPKWETDGGLEPDWVEKTTSDKEKFALVADMVDLMGIGHLSIAQEIMVEILKANRVAQNWKAVEGAKGRVENMTPDETHEAIAFGAVRRALGQGWDPAGVNQLEAESSEGGEEEILPQSVIRSVLGSDATLHSWVADHIACPWVCVALERAVRVHVSVEDMLFNMSNIDTDY